MSGTASEVRRMWSVLGLLVIFTASVSQALTDPRDVFAINSLHAALGSPLLPGWLPLGGDPCSEAWQGVQCVNSNITGISLNDANLGGELGTNLDSFISVISIDLSGNHIGGTIPSNLPPTIRTLFLSDNQFTGSIPDGLASLGQITDLSLNNNNLTGAIPDAFQSLDGLINLDLSGNNISGPLPPSMGNLSALSTLHLQDNKLTGMLDVLQDLALSDLNVENNQFSGPIPPKLLTVPNFRGTGNPFNTTALPSSPSPSPSPSPAAISNSTLPKEPPPKDAPKRGSPPSVSETRDSSLSTSSKKSLTAKTVMWSAIVVLLLLLGIGLGFTLCVAKCRKTGKDEKLISEPDETSWYKQTGLKSKCGESLPETYKQTDPGMKPWDARKVNDKKETDGMVTSGKTRIKDDHTIDIKGAKPQPPAPPTLHYSPETTSVKPVVSPKESTMGKQTITLNTQHSLKSFTVATLQEYTDSFSEENLIGEGVLGSVYRAELPDGKLVAVKKLNSTTSSNLSDKELADLLSSLTKLQHRNIVKLVGYCFEHGQRLLIYEYCNNGTLHDALHFDDEIHRKLSWNSRVRVALGAASALEYMHEFCQPPIVHKNFKSLNILLDDQLMPQISDCGMAPLFTNGSKNQLAQLSASGYGAPELEHGSFTQQSDVFSFGVVMLELLTGRKSYDRSRARGDQFLVTWAVSRLHDIDSLSKMVDPSLNGAYPSKALSRFADIISLCLQGEPEFRPPMSEIVQRLQNMVQKEL